MVYKFIHCLVCCIQILLIFESNFSKKIHFLKSIIFQYYMIKIVIIYNLYFYINFKDFLIKIRVIIGYLPLKVNIIIFCFFVICANHSFFRIFNVFFIFHRFFKTYFLSLFFFDLDDFLL